MRAKNESAVNRVGNGSFILFCCHAPMQTGVTRPDSLVFRFDALAARILAAETSVRRGQGVDLTALMPEIGRLCARILELPVGQGRTLRPGLCMLRNRIEALNARLIAARDDA